MTNPNTALWNEAFMTDPKAVKPITGKSYKGNSPKPFWLIERATQVFGPVGIGWGCTVKSERFERVSDTDVLHVAVVSIWYVWEGKRSESVDQMGGTKACYKTSSGSLLVDEDAGKKSVTDGMVKCLSMIGFAGDIFSGRWDDSKYVQHAAEEWAARNDPEAAAREARGAELEELALFLVDCNVQENDGQAIEVWYSNETWDNDPAVKQEEQTYVWGLLKANSKLRSAIKANHPDRLAAAAAKAAAEAAKQAA